MACQAGGPRVVAQARVRIFVTWYRTIGGCSLRNTDLRRQFLALALAGSSPRSIRSKGELAVGTATGLVRNDNQDVVLYLRARRPSDPGRDFQVSIICDGMGGLKAGKEAAALAASRFAFALLKETRIGRESCLRAARTADAAVYQRMNGAGGTTLSAVITAPNGLCIGVHIGDSRIYAIYDSGGTTQVSKDDNLRSALNRKHDIDPSLGSRLIQFVGMGDEIEPHVFRMPDGVRKFLITSDGAHSDASPLLDDIVRFSPNNSEIVRRLLNIAEYTGGLDNASAIVVPAVAFDSESWPIVDDAQVITLMTPFDSVDFYLPDPLADPAESQYKHRGGSPSQAEPRPTSPHSTPLPPPTPTPNEDGTANQPTPKGAKPPKSRKGKAPRKKAQSEGQLPLESAPSVSVEFPEGNGEL